MKGGSCCRVVRTRRSERMVTTAGATFETTGAYESIPAPISRSTAPAAAGAGVLAAEAGRPVAQAPAPTASAEAAAIKGITSQVAGDPDILLVPDLEAGNMLAKQLSFLANADCAGLVLGARVPIVLTSRSDALRARIASCAVAMLVAKARQRALQSPLRGA